MAQVGRNDPCPCGSGKKYKKCHGAVNSGAEMLRTAQVSGFRVSQDFKDRAKLKYIGPVIKGAWQLAPEDEQRLTLAGQPIPERIKGYVLIDTGAGETAIDEDVARELNLMPVAQRLVQGVGGVGAHNVYTAAIFLEVGDIHGNKVAISLHKNVAAVKKLRENHDAFGLKAPDGSPMRIIGLLGRDFLQFTTLTYNGLTGNWDMEIDPGVLQPWQGV